MAFRKFNFVSTLPMVDSPNPNHQQIPTIFLANKVARQIFRTSVLCRCVYCRCIGNNNNTIAYLCCVLDDNTTHQYGLAMDSNIQIITNALNLTVDGAVKKTYHQQVFVCSDYVASF